MSTKIRKALFISFLLCNGGFAFAQKWYTSDVDKKVDEILNQMTIQEKLDYISGDFQFHTKPIKRLGVPAIRMSDGPQGVGHRIETNAYPCGLALAATWNEKLLMNTDSHWDGIAELVEYISYWDRL